MLLLIALMPIILPLVLLVGLRVPARYAMAIAALTVALLGATLWGMGGEVLAASALQGMHRALSILWILLGAIFFLYVMQQTGAMERIKQGFFTISADMRVQVVLVAFAFVAIIEGVSGFGTPSAIAVPLLMTLGFHPLSSIVLALVGDSAPTSFGALGTPLTVGLSNISGESADFLSRVAMQTVVVDALFIVLLPLLLVGILVVMFGAKRQRRRDILEVAPWALLVSGTYLLTAFAAVALVGYEFASVIAGAAALLVGVITAHRGVLQPAIAWRHHATGHDHSQELKHPSMSLARAWAPYFGVILLLLLQRTVPWLRDWSQTTLDLSLHGVLGFESIVSQWQLLYSPGTALLLVALVTATMSQQWRAALREATWQTASKVATAGMALISTLIMVQIFANSGLNTAGLASMPIYIAELCAQYLGPVWLAVAPTLGMAAAFIMGSSTVSTLTMSPIQYSVAVDLGHATQLAMAQQIAGANAGNIIAVHNVVAAASVAGLHHQEGRIIRRVLPMAGVYLVCIVVVSIIVGLL